MMDSQDRSHGKGRALFGSSKQATPLDIARQQLSDSRLHFCEGPEGTFRSNGVFSGCGYAEIICVVNPQTGIAGVDINAHLRTDPKQRKTTARLLDWLNERFIVPGLELDDMCIVHYHPANVDLNAGGDLDDYIGKGLSTVHAEAWKFTALAAGADPWTLI